jgi:hypothetical protein
MAERPQPVGEFGTAEDQELVADVAGTRLSDVFEAGQYQCGKAIAAAGPTRW